MNNKNRLEVRLDPETTELLNSLLARTKLTKTSLIKNCLKVYASSLKNGHIYSVHINSVKSIIQNSNDPDKYKELDNLDWNNIVDELDQ